MKKLLIYITLIMLILIGGCSSDKNLPETNVEFLESTYDYNATPRDEWEYNIGIKAHNKGKEGEYYIVFSGYRSAPEFPVPYDKGIDALFQKNQVNIENNFVG